MPGQDLNTLSKMKGVSVRILSLLTSQMPDENLIEDIVLRVRDGTSFEAVGLRLVDGFDPPV